jgi:hypothetical protein
MKVISLCDYTGNMVKPWAEAGYECICVDTQHSIRRDKAGDNITYIWADVRSWWPESFDDVAAVFAFPPCTHLASSGARDWEKKGLTLLIDGLQLVEACRRIIEASKAPGFIENPRGRLSTIWRKPNYEFDPSDYAGYLKDKAKDAYTKKTCLYTFGGFVMPPHKPVVPMGSRMHLMPPSPDRANKRSETPMGFAQAVFEANHKQQLNEAA